MKFSSSVCQLLSSEDLPERILWALDVLREAWVYAEQTNSSRWEFAVELEELRAIGLTLNDLRWMARQELVQYKKEVTKEDEDRRRFAFLGNLSFPERTCFVLSPNPKVVPVRSVTAPELEAAGRDCVDPVWGVDSSGDARGLQNLPVWRSEVRALVFHGRIVKRFRWPASNQEAVLNAFQEEGWPERIEDPIPPHAGQEPKRRLADTIKCLNRKQASQLIHFRGDGTGEGVIWEPVLV